MSEVRLTERGERVVLAVIGTGKVVGVLGGMLLLMGVAGWIEGM